MTSADNHSTAAATLGSAVMSDVLDGLGLRNQCLGWDVVPLCGLAATRSMAGRAFPFELEAVEAAPEVPYVGLLAALGAVGPEQVVVMPTGRDTSAAVWGELLSAACRARGAAGVVTDGLVRDITQVDELGFPVFGRGTLPIDVNGRLEIVGHGTACEVDGVRIEPGDMIVGDVDGVVVVPSDAVAEAVASGTAKAESEGAFKRAVEAGMSPSEAYRTYGVL